MKRILAIALAAAPAFAQEGAPNFAQGFRGSNVDTYRMGASRQEGFWDSLECRLIDAAVRDTPTPADLPGTPLERLERLHVREEG